MYNDTVTVFNYYEDKKKSICRWYPTVLHDVELQINHGITVTTDGNANDNTASLHIRNDLDKYLNPVAFKRAEDRENHFTLGQKDFFVEGELDLIVIDEDDYPNGFFEYIKSEYDNVFKITTVERYKVIPHFEVGGK